jgi:mediator of RNA polymerase II transcription subunit 5
MFAVVCQLFDHDAILQAMVQEINRTSFSDMPTALDVATSLICAPASVPMGAQQVSRSSSPVAKLRDSVRLITANVQGLLDKPVSEAETLVRLSRRVEAQLAFAAHMPAIAIPMQMQEQAADQIMQDLGLTMDSNNTSGPGAEESTNQPTDMAGLGQQIDLSNLNNATSEDIAKMAAETGTMDIDQTNQVFMDFGMDTTDQQNSNTHTSDQQISSNNQEEDIFAGLVMMNDYELDFN